MNNICLSDKDREEMISLISSNKLKASVKDGLYLTAYLDYKKQKTLRGYFYEEKQEGNKV